MRLAAGLLILTFAPAADAATLGEMLSASCWSCHGPRGASPGAIPPLTGRSAQSIAADMAAYRTGQKAGTVMPIIAKGYNETETAALAAVIAAIARADDK
jgi:cytochrome c553